MPSSSRSSGASERRDRGQATVETALALPVVVLALAVVLQVGLVVRAQVLVTHAAREGARTAAVEPSRAAIRRSAVEASGLPADQIDVVVSGTLASGDPVTVEVRHHVPVAVPLLAGLIDAMTVTSEVTMLVE